MVTLRARLPALRVMSRSSLRTCMERYIAIGWTSAIPDACKRTLLVIPIGVAPWLWGWPNLFLERMNRVGTPVFIAGPSTIHATGLDTKDLIERLPRDFSGGIWTNRIDVVGPLFGRQPSVKRL